MSTLVTPNSPSCTFLHCNRCMLLDFQELCQTQSIFYLLQKSHGLDFTLHCTPRSTRFYPQLWALDNASMGSVWAVFNVHVFNTCTHPCTHPQIHFNTCTHPCTHPQIHMEIYKQQTRPHTFRISILFSSNICFCIHNLSFGCITMQLAYGCSTVLRVFSRGKQYMQVSV